MLATYGTTNDYSWTTENWDVEDFSTFTRADVKQAAIDIARNAWDYGMSESDWAEYGDSFETFVAESGEVDAIEEHIENWLVSHICE